MVSTCITKLTMHRRRRSRQDFFFYQDFNYLEEYKESQTQLGWTEETCAYLDEVAAEDHSYYATRAERARFETYLEVILEQLRNELSYDSET